MDISKDNYINNESCTIIHTPDLTAKTNFFYAEEAGRLMPEDAHSPFCRKNVDSFLIAAVIKGRGELSVGDVKTPLVQGDCLFIDCQQSYVCRSSETEPWEIMWVCFNGSTSRGYYEMFREASGNVFRPVYFDKVISAVREISQLCADEQRHTDILCSKLIVDILTIALTSIDNEEQYDSGLKKKLAMVNSYIDDHFSEDLSLERLSAEFYISKFYLTREYKKIYGRTIFQHIINVRINYGKKLLRFTDRSIEEIAHLCGFNDQSYFARQFKKAEGLTCLSYRKKWRE